MSHTRDGKALEPARIAMPVIEGASNFTITGNARLYEIPGGDEINHLRDPSDIEELNRIWSIVNARLPLARASLKDYETRKNIGPCFPGTREALLREMMDWATEPGESRMYVFSGLAGIGKSTVVYTLATQADELGLLGASFFFSREDNDRNNAERFFTTIAYQLCVCNSEIFGKAIGHVVQTERGFAATTQDPREQLKVLILEPLQNIVQSYSRPILIVVDALDECDEEDVFPVLTGLSQLVQDLPSFKVILSTRPQPYLDQFMSSQGGHKFFHLQEIEDKVVDGDIRLYLNHSLSQDQVQIRFRKQRWSASDEEIAALVHAAGRLFIIASTAIRYILDKSVSNPAAQMQKLLRAFAQDRVPFKDLDHFYTVILRNVVPANCNDDAIISRYQSVVGTIVLLQRPLPVSTLAHLINIDADDVRSVLYKLQSVILLGSDDVPRVYHKSFPNYITDWVRCRDPDLRINTRILRHMHIGTITEYLIEHATRLTEQPDFHGTDHFAPEFGSLIKHSPQATELDVEEWEQILRPLLNVLDKLLKPSKLDSLKVRYCEQCRFFQLTYDILTQFKSLREREDSDVEECIKALQEIIQYGDDRQQDFDMPFGRVIYGLGATAGILVAILAHQR